MTEKEQDAIGRKIRREYAKAEKCIRDLGRKVKEAVEKEDVEAALRTYDCILQSLLLKEALADGVVATEEIDIIENTVNHGDIMRLLAQTVPAEYAPFVRWESLSELPSAAQQLIGARADMLIEESSDEFVLFVALANLATRKDYGQVLIDATADILTAFSALAGARGAAALAVGAEAFQDVFVLKYVRTLQHIDEFCSAAEFLDAARSFLLGELERYEKQALREQRREAIKQKFRSVFGKKEGADGNHKT